MPLYEYRCARCGRVFEAYKRLSDEVKGETCPACGGESVRAGLSLVSPAKGSGPSAGSSCGSGSRRSPFG